MQRSRAPFAGAAFLAVCLALLPQRADAEYLERGTASWYGERFQGLQTASGEIFDMNLLTAAHRDLPFGTRVKVINLRTGASVSVVINDRGPCVDGRAIDLSMAAARALGMVEQGLAPVLLEADPHEVAPAERGQTRTSIGC
jgi:rare lipoprotein A